MAYEHHSPMLRSFLFCGLSTLLVTQWACSSTRSPAEGSAGSASSAGTGFTAGAAGSAGAGEPAGNSGVAGSEAAGASGAVPAMGGTAGGGGAGASGAGTAGAAPTPASKCKRGLAVGDDLSANDLKAFGSSVSWFYDWGSRFPSKLAASDVSAAGVEFAPMIYGGEPNAAQETASIPAGARFLLGFNEPNFHSEGNLAASAAAALWPHLEAIATARQLELVSPAVNYCGPASTCWDTDPFSYLDDFFAACPTCRVDYVAVHWYACDTGALTWYLSQAKKYGKPVWLTEFNCPGGNAAAQLAYLKAALPVLEADPQVFRYSWLMARSSVPEINLLAGDGQLTELGQAYVSAAVSPECAAERGL